MHDYKQTKSHTNLEELPPTINKAGVSVAHVNFKVIIITKTLPVYGTPLHTTMQSMLKCTYQQVCEKDGHDNDEDDPQ